MFRTRSIMVLLTLPIAGVVIAGCSDDDKATPQVIFEGSIEAGASGTCHDARELFLIGDFGNPAADTPTGSAPVRDGEQGRPEPYNQGAVQVACSVTSAGADTFNVSGSINLDGATGGFFKIDGVFKTTGEQTGIHAQFSSRLSTNIYDETDRQCTVTYTTQFQGVAAGRVWGHLVCPKAENVKTADGTSCQGVADFRFENCAQ